MNIEAHLSARLHQLGCERLPSAVVKALREKVGQSVEKAIGRIVEREISASKIAKIFLQEVAGCPAKSKGGFKGDRATVPFDQPDPLVLPWQNESGAVTGTTTANHHSQP